MTDQHGPSFSDNRRRDSFTRIVVTIAVLACASYGIIRLAPAEHFGDLAWKLVAAAFLGMLAVFLVSMSFTSGSSGSLGAAVFGLLLELFVIALALGFAGYWSDSVVAVHERAQWSIFGIQTLYLLFVGLA